MNPDAGNIVDHCRPWATKGSIGWFRPDLFLGSHDFKAGYDDVKTTSGRGWISRPSTVGGDYALRFNNGVPLEFVAYNAPNFPRTIVHTTAVYVADKWSVGRRSRSISGSAGPVTTGTFRRSAGRPVLSSRRTVTTISRGRLNSPGRLVSTSTYDVTGNGKTALKGGWGRFSDWRNGNHVLPLNPNVALQRRYRWHDLNGNGDYDPGEVNLSH